MLTKELQQEITFQQHTTPTDPPVGRGSPLMSLTGGVGARSPRKRSRGEGAEAAVAADGRRGTDGEGKAGARAGNGCGVCTSCK